MTAANRASRPVAAWLASKAHPESLTRTSTATGPLPPNEACKTRTRPTHHSGDEVGVVAHREVVALCDGDLVGVGEARLPFGLEAQRVVALPEDGEHGSVRQSSHSLVNAGVVVASGGAHVVVQGSNDDKRVVTPPALDVATSVLGASFVALGPRRPADVGMSSSSTRKWCRGGNHSATSALVAAAFESMAPVEAGRVTLTGGEGEVARCWPTPPATSPDHRRRVKGWRSRHGCGRWPWPRTGLRRLRL